MPLVIEDGSPNGGNSYITPAELSTFLSDRGYPAIAGSTTVLIRAYDFMRGLPWCDDHSEAYDVTDNMKTAQCEIAYRVSSGADPSATPEQSVKRKKIDVLEKEFFSGRNIKNSMDLLKNMPFAYSLLESKLCGGGGSYLLRA